MAISKRNELALAFSRIATDLSYSGHRGSSSSILSADWVGGLYELPGLEMSLYRVAAQQWTLEALARRDGVLSEIRDSDMALLVDYKIVLKGLACVRQVQIVEDAIAIFTSAAREESLRLADALLAQMEGCDG